VEQHATSDEPRDWATRADIGAELADSILKYLFSISDINSVESSMPIARRVPPHASLAYRCASRRTREQTILAMGARRTVSSCEQSASRHSGRSRPIANSREPPRQTSQPRSDTKLVFHVEHCLKLYEVDFIRFWPPATGGMEDLVDRGPHFICGAGSSVRNDWPDGGFIPLITFLVLYILGSRSLVSASACSSPLRMATG
jgi:hypothetical protein